MFCIFTSEIWTKKRSATPIFGSKNGNKRIEDLFPASDFLRMLWNDEIVNPETL